MFWLCFLLPICYIAGYTGAYIPTQWVVLSALLPLSLWVPAPSLVLNRLGAAFFCYALFSMMWLTGWYSAVLGAWQIFIWALAFRWGSAVPDLSPMWRGLAVGLSISACFAIAQHFGAAFPAIDFDTHGRAPGLLFNPVVSGMASAIVIIGCASHRLWWYTPLPLLGLALSGSRGGWLLLALAALARWHWTISLAALAIGSLVFAHFAVDSDIQRLQIWGIALQGLTPLGWGPDAFNDVFAMIPDAVGPHLVHLEFVHNDYIQLVFDYGIGAASLFIILACGLSRTSHPDWLALFACALSATFFFPLFHPLTAFIVCALTGHLAADWDRAWRKRIHRRLARLSRHPIAQRILASGGLSPIPMEP